MVAAPLAALDLPLKVVVWAADDYQTRLSYTAPAALADRYGLSTELTARLAGIDALTSAVVARWRSSAVSSRSAAGRDKSIRESRRNPRVPDGSNKVARAVTEHLHARPALPSDRGSTNEPIWPSVATA